jgi:uncharacterized membrane protein YebE (DUF533 family)
MLDAKSLLDRFLGPGAGQQAAGAAGGLGEAAQRAMGGLGGAGPLVGAAAAGGLLALLAGGKRRRLGGLVSHGGAAVLGALASQAWRNWQAGRPPEAAPAATPALPGAVEPRFLPSAAPAADGAPFELALVRAMIAAARADGHVDAAERARIFEQVEKAGLDAEAKAFVFDNLDRPVGVSEVAAAAATPEQGAELYLAARLTIAPDTAEERAFLDALAHLLKLPAELALHLDRQAEAARAA